MNFYVGLLPVMRFLFVVTLMFMLERKLVMASVSLMMGCVTYALGNAETVVAYLLVNCCYKVKVIPVKEVVG